MFTDDMFTAGITVEVDGKRFEAHSTISPEVARTVSLEVIMRPLRRQIMGAIEQQLFGDFNRRDY